MYHLDLYNYWDAKRAGRPMPARADLDPTEIPALLPHMILIDVDGGRFRYRLAGTQIALDMGRELTGTLVGAHATPADHAAEVCAIHSRVCDRRRPVFTTREYRSASRVVQAVSRLLLPLGHDGDGVDMILVSHVARYPQWLRRTTDWLDGVRGRIGITRDVGSADEVDTLFSAWEQACARLYKAA